MTNAPSPTVSAIPLLPDGWHALSFKVLTGGRLAVVGSNADLQAAWLSDHKQRTVGEAWRLATEGMARVWTLSNDDLIEHAEFPLLEPFPQVEQFPDGRWLVANARSRGSGNARILSKDGAEIRRVELGDGIEHIKIDSEQRIWVGWFDEGVFGNDNWRLPGRKLAPSAHGIAAFDEQGALLEHATLQSIADCYALNVSGSAAWACTYTDFPIWQMANGQEQTWTTPLRGIRALAVAHPHVLAAGGYKEEANRVVLLRLGDSRAEVLDEWRLPFDVGYPADVNMIDGRDDHLHVVRDGQWHRWRVSDCIKR